MNTYNNGMKFIAQFKASIAGCHVTEIVDVFLNDLEDSLFIFKRRNNKTFELLIIDKTDYLEKEFKYFLLNPNKINSDCNLLFIWRASICLNPELLPEEYYLHILELNNIKDLRYNNKIRCFNKELNKFIKNSKNILED